MEVFITNEQASGNMATGAIISEAGHKLQEKILNFHATIELKQKYSETPCVPIKITLSKIETCQSR